MWGMTVRLRGERFESGIPHWLLNAAQTHSATRYLQRVAAELNRSPETYGFDPDALYSVCVQTWDRASDPIASLAFGRKTSGQGHIGLIPDVYYIDSEGYLSLRKQAIRTLPWTERFDTVVWRGSVTGSGPYEEPEDIPRLGLAKACRSIPGTDAALFAVHSTMEHVFPIDRINGFIDDHDLRGKPLAVASFGHYRYSIDIDGHANAWGLLEKLILGCCVLKVASPFEQWYYDRLKPWVHYVPVSADLSDLAERIEWCRSNPGQSAWIAANGAMLAATLTIDREVPGSCLEFLRVARQNPADRAEPQVNRDHIKYVVRTAADGPFAKAAAFARQGNLAAAIGAYRTMDEAPGLASRALTMTAELHAEQGEIAAMIAALRDAVRDTGNLEPQVKLAHALAALGRDHEAASILLAARRPGPGFAEASIFLSQAASRLGWHDIASRVLPKLDDHEPDWWTEARDRAQSDLRLHRESLKRLFIKRRETAGIGDDGLLWDLAMALFAVGRLSSARRLCDVLAAKGAALVGVADLTAKIIARGDGAQAALAYLKALPFSLQAEPTFAHSLARYLPECDDYEGLLAIVPPDEASPVAEAYDIRLAKALALLWLGRDAELQAHCRAWLQQSPIEVLPAALAARRLPCPTMRTAGATCTIPGQIAHYWQSGEPPADVARNLSSWTIRHPNLDRQVFDRVTARDFLAVEHGDEAVAAFDRCGDARNEAHLFGLAWLDRRGGLFVDVDQFCLQPMPSILEALPHAEIIAPRAGTPLGFLKRGLLGGRAGSRIIGAALASAIAALNAMPPEGLSPWHALGAGLLTLETGRYVVEHGTTPGDGTVLLLPPQVYEGYFQTEIDLAYRQGG